MPRGRKPGPINHGTHTGFTMHKYRGEQPCGWCKRGERAYQNAYDQRGRCVPGLGWPLEARRG